MKYFLALILMTLPFSGQVNAADIKRTVETTLGCIDRNDLVDAISSGSDMYMTAITKMSEGTCFLIDSGSRVRPLENQGLFTRADAYYDPIDRKAHMPLYMLSVAIGR